MEELLIEFKNPSIPRSLYLEYIKTQELQTTAVDSYSQGAKSNSQNNIDSVDMKIKENGINHATYRYYIMESDPPSLVVRRGKSFEINVTLKNPFSKDCDSLKITVCWVSPAQTSNEAASCVPVQMTQNFTGTRSQNEWQAICSAITRCGTVLCLRVLPPVGGMIGRYKLEIGISWRGQQVQNYCCPIQVIVLFNAWDSQDQAFVADAVERQTYLMNEDAYIYAGVHTAVNGYIWKYSQFSCQVLMAVLHLGASLAGILPNEWSDIVTVAKKMVQAIEAPNGMIECRWDEKYSDGKNPSDWSGSAEILNQWFSTKKVVKYGQSFQMSCVLTTIFRTLGVAARNVTNFDSGVDFDRSCTIDVFFSDDEALRKEWNLDRKSESTWSYHVWCEIWMRRSDGTSNNQISEWSAVYSFVGPAIVGNVKDGLIKEPYDTECFYAFVNADICNWKVDRQKPIVLINVDTTFVGKCVLTCGQNKSKLDITDTYKYKESTKKERDINMFVLRQKDPRFKDNEKNLQIQNFDFILNEVKYVYFGESFTLTVTMVNRSETAVVIVAGIIVYKSTCTNNTTDILKKIEKTLTINKGDSTKLNLEVTRGDYEKYFSDYSYVKYFAYGSVQEPCKCEYLRYDTFQIFPHRIECEVQPPNPKTNEPIDIKACFNNKSNTTISGRFQFVELDTGKQENLPNLPILPDGKYCTLFRAVPRKVGTYSGRISFVSECFRTSVAVQLNVRC